MLQDAFARWLAGFAVFFALGTSGRARAQEIPLEPCDSLPLVEVEIDGRSMHLLVDTAATSLLNLKSFAEGRARDVRITSWTGTLATSAREVSISEMVVGRTKLVLLKLPAVDLSAIGKACGRKIDGVLGADLLARLGATIDLRRQTMHLATADDERGMQLAREMHQEMVHCVAAFNDSDERTFGDCLEPEIVLFTKDRALTGRDAVVRYFRETYFHQKPAATLAIRESAFHPLGEAGWYEYEFTLKSVHGAWSGRGMAICRKSNERWRMASVQHTLEHVEPWTE
jgi:ketosteroid isomerase-like protein